MQHKTIAVPVSSLDSDILAKLHVRDCGTFVCRPELAGEKPQDGARLSKADLDVIADSRTKKLIRDFGTKALAKKKLSV